MRTHNVKRIVFSSSSTVYGDVKPEPLLEEHGPLRPTSLYGAGKLSAEAFISAYHYLFDINALIFRFANIVGKRMGHGVIFDFINKLKKNSKEMEILGDGKQSKPFVYVDDCVDAVVLGFEKIKEGFKVFNVGSPTIISVTRIAQIVAEEMGLKDASFRYTGGRSGWKGDVPQFRFNIQKLENLGWRVKYDSEGAVRKAVRDLLDNNI